MGKRSSSSSAMYKLTEENDKFQPFKRSPKFAVSSKSEEQSELLSAIHNNTITFVRGPAGCGKTYLSVYYGLSRLYKGDFRQLICTRPAVEADGDHLGYLPGDINEKIDPYMAPIFDSVTKLVGSNEAEKLLRDARNSTVRVLPIAFMRGVTFDSSFCIVDEAQNVNSRQMRMILTRLGSDSKIVIAGDDRQSDIREKNGLVEAFQLFRGIEDIALVEMTEVSIVRHPLVAKIEERYEKEGEIIAHRIYDAA